MSPTVTATPGGPGRQSVRPGFPAVTRVGMPRVVALVGPHGAGKTTLGRCLAQLLGWRFDAEVGERLARRCPVWAGIRRETFDERVFATETLRDLARGACPRVVETWHPGNLAYAEARAPRVVERWLPVLRTRTRAVSALVVPICAAPSVLAARQHEPGDIGFFMRVGSRAEHWARRLGVHVAPAVYTDRGQSPRELAQKVVETVLLPIASANEVREVPR